VNSRERTIATALLATLALAAGAFLFYRFYLAPVADLKERIRIADVEDEQRQQRMKEVHDHESEMAKLRKLSLPSEVAFSQLGYHRHLEKMIERNGISTRNLVVKPRSSSDVFRGGAFDKKDPFLNSVSFTITGHTDLSGLLKLLVDFYSTPLLHKIRTVSITHLKSTADRKTGDQAQKSRELQITLDVEALIVKGAETRDEILPKNPPPPGNLAQPARDYLAMVSKDIFFGPPPPTSKVVDGTDPATSVKLTSITGSEGDHWLVLCNTTDNTMWWLYPDRRKDPKDVFEIKNKSGELKVQGEVTRVDGSNVIFRSGEKYYSMRVGQTVAEALRKPLTDAQVKAMQPTRAPANHPIRAPENNGAQ